MLTKKGVMSEHHVLKVKQQHFVKVYSTFFIKIIPGQKLSIKPLIVYNRYMMTLPILLYTFTSQFA